MDKSHIHTHILHRTLLFLRLSSRIHTFLFPAIFPLSSQKQPFFPCISRPFSTSNSSIIIVCSLSLNLHDHAHRRPASCRLSIIPPIPKRYRPERHFSFRRPARSPIDSGRGKSHCTRWMQTAENKLISPAQISSELKSSSSAAHSMTTTGKTNSKNSKRSHFPHLNPLTSLSILILVCSWRKKLV